MTSDSLRSACVRKHLAFESRRTPLARLHEYTCCSSAQGVLLRAQVPINLAQETKKDHEGARIGGPAGLWQKEACVPWNPGETLPNVQYVKRKAWIRRPVNVALLQILSPRRWKPFKKKNKKNKIQPLSDSAYPDKLSYTVRLSYAESTSGELTQICSPIFAGTTLTGTYRSAIRESGTEPIINVRPVREACTLRPSNGEHGGVTSEPTVTHPMKKLVMPPLSGGRGFAENGRCRKPSAALVLRQLMPETFAAEMLSISRYEKWAPSAFGPHHSRLTCRSNLQGQGRTIRHPKEVLLKGKKSDELKLSLACVLQSIYNEILHPCAN